MAIDMKPIEEIPKEALQRQTRSSVCTDTIEEIKALPSKRAALTAETPAELDKFYKTLIQWRSRHKDQNVNFRKTKDVLYVWIGEAEEVEEADATKRSETNARQAAEAAKLAAASKRQVRSRS